MAFAGNYVKVNYVFYRGLGAVICEKFVSEGANVAINYANSKEPADELAKKLEKYGTKIVVFKAVSSNCLVEIVV